MHAEELLTPMVDIPPGPRPKPRADQRSCLIVMTGSSVGEVHRVDREISLGSSPEADITLLDEGVTRHHCVLRPNAEAIEIVDLNSTNGTFVRGERVTTCNLENGDRIHLGAMTVLKFTLSDELEESFQRQLYDAALRDGLTGAFNRRYFDERLHAEFAYAKRHKTPLSLCIVDLDHFKNINDTHGHVVGDKVLEGVAGQIMDTVRTEDVFSRTGGEEFALISAGVDVPGARVMADRVRGAVERFALLDNEQGVSVGVTLSAGVASLSEEIESPEDLLAAADRALYAAKADGRNLTRVHDE